MKDGFLTKADLQGKHIFWDVDGVLAPFRFQDKIWPNDDRKRALNQDMVDAGVFYDRAPCKLVQRVLRQSEAKSHRVLGKYVYSGEIAQKKLWLDEYYPEMSDYIWVPVYDSKAVYLYQRIKAFGWRIEDVVFIDDTIDELFDAERNYGIKSVHISSLLNWEE